MMIQEFVDIFMSKKQELRAFFEEKHPDDYKDIVTQVVRILNGDKDSGIDPERITEIDDGCYSGILLYVIGEAEYMPDDYWYVKIAYGSCSGCDTLESIRECSDEKPTPQQVDDYMTLSLHIVQQLKKMDDDIC